MPKLTKCLVDAAEARSAEYFIWDSDIPGFGLRVLPSRRKGYVVQYRTGRQSHRISLGSSTVLTCEQVRRQAILDAFAKPDQYDALTVKRSPKSAQIKICQSSVNRKSRRKSA